MPGDNSVCLVNPKNLVHDKVTNFFGNDAAHTIKPMTSIASFAEKKVLGVYMVGETPEGLHFVFLRAGHGMVRKKQKDIIGSKSIKYF
jgi:hypothetical protein